MRQSHQALSCLAQVAKVRNNCYFKKTTSLFNIQEIRYTSLQCYTHKNLSLPDVIDVSATESDSNNLDFNDRILVVKIQQATEVDNESAKETASNAFGSEFSFIYDFLSRNLE